MQDARHTLFGPKVPAPAPSRSPHHVPRTGLSSQSRRAAARPRSRLLKLCCETEKRSLIPEAPDKMGAYRQTFGIPEERH